MSQNAQSLKTEIITSLDTLSSDSLQLVAEFVAFLRARGKQPVAQKDTAAETPEADLKTQTTPARVFSPRLARREQLVDFKKEIVEVSADDGV